MFLMHHSLQRVGRLLFKCNSFAIPRKTITTTPIRSGLFNIGKRMGNEQYYKKLDKIDPTYTLIYRAPFEYLTALCKHVTSFNLVTVSSLLAYQFVSGVTIVDTSVPFTLGPSTADTEQLIGFVVAFYVFNLTLAYAVTRYPLRIYKLKNRYCAIFEGYLPFSPRQYQFQQGDVCLTKSITPWYECMYKVKDKSVLLFSHHFKRPSDFHELLRKKK